MKASKSRNIYRFLISLSPYLRQLLIRWLYNTYTSKNNSEKNIFLNFGYHDDTPLPLNPLDEPNRFFIQLYHRAVQNIDLRDKDIVEVGCGQGAGGVFLLQYKNPRSYIGIDLSEKAIELCQRQNQFANAQWRQGSAGKLPVPDNSADVVINIESSHLYPSMKEFVSEVRRILKPNGYMAFADLYPFLQLDALDKCFDAAGLQVLQRSDITPQVLDSLTRLSDRRKAHINATWPVIWRQAIRDLCAVQGSVLYNRFLNGQQKYVCYLLQK